MKKNLKKIISLTVILGLVSLIYPPAFTVNAAGVLTSATDTLSRQKAAVNANHYVKFTTATTGTIEHYIVEFPDGFGLASAVDPTLEVKVAGVDKSGNGAWTFDDTGGSKDATWTYTTPIEVANSVAIELWFETVMNPSVESYTLTLRTQNASEVDIDNTTVKVDIIDDDQVSVSATVPQSIAFSIEVPTDNAMGFGTWATTEVRYPTDDNNGSTGSEPGNGLPIQLKVSTNSSSGLTVSGKSEGSGSAAGLYKSTATAHNIVAVASSAVSATEEEYGVYVKNAAAGLTIDEGFDNDTTSDVAITYASIALVT
jgi:hypothetical protein